jgi:hypothetical protein
MQLEQWFAEMIAHAENFRNQWIELAKQFPKDFPLEMELGDWNEQFQIPGISQGKKSCN